MNWNYCLYLHKGTYASTKTCLLTFSSFTTIMNPASHSLWGGGSFLGNPLCIAMVLLEYSIPTLDNIHCNDQRNCLLISAVFQTFSCLSALVRPKTCRNYCCVFITRLSRQKSVSIVNISFCERLKYSSKIWHNSGTTFYDSL